MWEMKAVLVDGLLAADEPGTPSAIAPYLKDGWEPIAVTMAGRFDDGMYLAWLRREVK